MKKGFAQWLLSMEDSSSFVHVRQFIKVGWITRQVESQLIIVRWMVEGSEMLMSGLAKTLADFKYSEE